jgi:hypothetical protein
LSHFLPQVIHFLAFATIERINPNLHFRLKFFKAPLVNIFLPIAQSANSINEEFFDRALSPRLDLAIGKGF